MKKKITSAEIAEFANVSRATVSYVLNGHAQRERIPETTVKRILRIVGETQYRPNGAARAMRRNRFDCLSLLMSSSTKGVWLPLGLLRNLQRNTAARGMHLNVSELPDSKLLSPEYAPKILRELLADGLLINYPQPVPSGLEEMLHRYSIPHIWLNEIRAHDCVYPDDFNGCIKAVELLAGMGHRRIAYLSKGGSQHYSHGKREQGFLAAARKGGIQGTSVCTGTAEDEASFRDQVEAMLRDSNRPTACIGYSALELQITFAVALRMDLRIPQDLSLLTFDVHHPPLGDLTQSTLTIPQREMADVAVDLLLKKIEQPAEYMDPAPIPYADDIGGETCAPPGGP